MPYGPQRRHAVGIIANACQALNLIQHLYQPNLLILVARMIAQMQITTAGIIHPNRSLMGLCLMLTLMNATAVLLHFLDHLGGPGKGIMLDFVGQSIQPSLMRLVLLDLLIYILQIHSITISYLNNKNTSTPTTPFPSLPYADLLLPIPDTPEEILPEDFDIESGLRRRKASSKGKGRAGNLDQDDGEGVWLDGGLEEGEDGEEEYDVQPSERDRLLNQSNPSKRTREPPRVISISISHLLNLIRYLPTPTPRIVAGTTPAVSPHTTPRPSVSVPVSATETLFTVPEEEEEEGDQVEEVARRSLVRGSNNTNRGINSDAARDSHVGRSDRRNEDEDRIPGSYIR